MEYDEAATMYDTGIGAVRQWAQVAGERRPDQAWLLHDRDIWVANPWYRGAPEPHPEW